jgi:uncharacterized DUF497 family protein
MYIREYLKATKEYLFIVFILKRNNEALIISAREMDDKEKSIYSKI